MQELHKVQVSFFVSSLLRSAFEVSKNYLKLRLRTYSLATFIQSPRENPGPPFGTRSSPRDRCESATTSGRCWRCRSRNSKWWQLIDALPDKKKRLNMFNCLNTSFCVCRKKTHICLQGRKSNFWHHQGFEATNSFWSTSLNTAETPEVHRQGQGTFILASELAWANMAMGRYVTPHQTPRAPTYGPSEFRSFWLLEVLLYLAIAGIGALGNCEHHTLAFEINKTVGWSSQPSPKKIAEVVFEPHEWIFRSSIPKDGGVEVATQCQWYAGI